MTDELCLIAERMGTAEAKHILASPSGAPFFIMSESHSLLSEARVRAPQLPADPRLLAEH